MTNAMIDLETLGTRHDSAIVSIGVAIFNDEQILESRGYALEPKSVHGYIDPKTVMWWMDQCEAARQFSFTGKYLDVNAAFDLKTLLAQFNVQEVWSKDPHFDHVILENWWHRVEERNHITLGEMYSYRAPRSYRTLETETIRAGFDPQEWAQHNYVAHNPVDDAVTQARAVIKMRQLLHGGRK